MAECNSESSSHCYLSERCDTGEYAIEACLDGCESEWNGVIFKDAWTRANAELKMECRAVSANYSKAVAFLDRFGAGEWNEDRVNQEDLVELLERLIGRAVETSSGNSADLDNWQLITVST